MVSRCTSSLVLVILPDGVVKIKFQFLPLDRYLISVVSGDRCLARGNKENVDLFSHYEFNCVQIDSASGKHTSFGFLMIH